MDTIWIAILHDNEAQALECTIGGSLACLVIFPSEPRPDLENPPLFDHLIPAPRYL